MPAELNRVFLLGRLTRDPELRYLESGTAVAKLGLAVNRTYVVNGERREEVCFVNVDAWGRTAENCHEYLRKGSQVLVEGRLVYRQWETDAGEKRSTIEVRAFSVQFLDRPDSSGDSGFGEPAERSAPARAAAPPVDDEIDDDIPF